MLISKILSGGQSGVERGALEAAYDLGFPYGGTVPKGRMAEDGPIPGKFVMEPSYVLDHQHSTRMNVVHSNATLVIARYNYLHKPYIETPTSLRGDVQYAMTSCMMTHRASLAIFRRSFAQVHGWLAKTAHDLKLESLVLFVTGPRESEAHGIQKAAYDFITELIRREREFSDSARCFRASEIV